MTIRENFFRFLALLTSVLFLAFLCFTPHLLGQQIAPLSEVKPGMKGYGLTVFRGVGPEKFGYEVKGILDLGTIKYIVVWLSGGPEHNGEEILSDANVLGGMSGSPLFDSHDRVIGAISRRPVGEKKPIALVTPIEDIVGFRSQVMTQRNHLISSVVSAGPGIISAGYSFEYCEVWGDENSCATGTVTLVDPSDPTIIYTLGHSGSSRTATMALPFWRSGVITHVPNMMASFKIATKVGPALGSVIFDGPFGQILKIGAFPKHVPMKIVMDRNLNHGLEEDVFMAYTPNMASKISRLILSRKKYFLSNLQDVDSEIRIDPIGLPQVFSYGYLGETTLAGLLSDIFLEDKPGSGIQNIRVVMRARGKYKKLALHEVDAAIKENGAKTSLEVKIKAVGERNDGRWQFSFLQDIDRDAKDRKLYVADGETIADKIIAGLKQDKESISLLNELSCRNCLYLFSAEEELSEKENNQPVVREISLDGAGAAELPTAGKKDASVRETAELSVWKKTTAMNQVKILHKIEPPAEDILVRGIKGFKVTIEEVAPRKKWLRLF